MSAPGGILRAGGGGTVSGRLSGNVVGVPGGFSAGSRIAGYRLTEQVGAGGMAVVFRAVDERLGRQVALKVLAPELAADTEFRERFIRESRAAAAVDDPHLVPVYEASEAGGALFIAMRFVAGGDVQSLVRRDGPQSPARIAGIISPVASALDAAHAAGLVHRDVKPANMLLDVREGRPDHVYLADFGISRHTYTAGLTGTGQFLGTADYCSPEQIQGTAVDGRADQYALACTAFELLGGLPPFRRNEAPAVIWAQMTEPPPLLTARRPDLPAAVDAVLARALAKRPEDRYPTCPAFADALRASLGLAAYHSGAPVIPRADDQLTGAWRPDDVPSEPTRDASILPVRMASNAPVLVAVDEGGQQRRRRSSLRLLVVALGAVSAVALGLGGWWLTAARHPRVPAVALDSFVRTPVVAGDSAAKATAALKASGFTVKRDEHVHSNTAPAGTVTGTSPAGRVAKGSAVTILVSAGPFTSTVPRVQGDTATAARAALAAAHLTAQIEKVGSDAKVGTVTGTKPAAGTSWPQTKPVTILVAAGPPLPDFTGESLQTAQQWAAQYGVSLQQQDVSSQEAPAGVVTSEQPAAGTTIGPGQAVTVDVSTGPPEVSVPDTVGDTQATAAQVLEAAGFEVEVSGSGTVSSYSPSGQAPAGSTITITLTGGVGNTGGGGGNGNGNGF